ncbi:ATP-dependent RNA helicase [Wickerhamomyces ciferrii]|uniref:ATP-dependent RNA helicase ROK1 n=1 Tax=Wickerhamomyces ciferrii (strain ATCC 14091 / BCRC 22168 / CBS 111 / JCM 3599 / NBRC 0793 / NRRL Y-1031 F-60-10) TaxID=1206466 RepID=K0K7U3_WICCF|nr:ATP-dependent RNA helicase [Wickerhamomyces ciferrii]CCH40885.1 ATP-dependent RNA helicase [Wickerhamomyces ciferrii]
MDIFRVLSRGASLKKSKDIVTDYALPSVKQSLNKDVEKEIDFFRTKKFSNLAKSEQDSQKEEEINQTHAKIEDEHNEPPPPKITNEDEARLLRKSYRANVTGNDIPLPIGSFEDLISRFKLDQQLLTNLIDSGFTEPTPIQSESLPITLFDRDVLACAPTGSGKTLAFIIPLIQQLINSNKQKNSGLRGLIISPTKELAQQIYEECNKLSSKLPLKVAILSKSISSKLKNKIIKKDKYDIIISTPLRLIDLVKNEALDLSKVEHLIFDEADKLFDKNFLEQTDDILTQCKNPRLRKSMFSATIPSNVEEIANQIMQNTIRLIIGHKEAANQQIEQKLTFCGNEEGKLIAIRQLIQEGEFKPPVLIFLQSITRAKALFHELLYDRLNVDVIHAERTQIQRQKIIERFRKGEIWVLICTDVLARGIDFKGVNLVINYDVPNSAQAYVHRIGRTGRGGREGKAVTLYTKEDSIAIKPIVNVMKQSGSNYDEWLDNLTKITKNEKQNIKKGQIKRKDISTVPKVVKQKRKQREDMIRASKRRKQLTNGEEGETNNNDSGSDSE